MTEWISPVDRHRHYGEAGRASCAVCRLEAERDRLRARVLELEGQAGDRERLLRDVLQDMRAERDRLGAALRAVMAETGTSSLAHHYARDALDGSTVMGRPRCPDCGNPLRFCDCPDRKSVADD